MKINSVDIDYLRTFGMKMAEGRFFSKEFPTDENEVYTVSWQSWKAATRNPVEALRYE